MQPPRPAGSEFPRGPADLVFKKKPELALELIARAIKDQIPGEIVLVDSAYGSSSEFGNAVRAHGLDLGVAVQANTKVWSLDSLERRRGEPVSVQDLGVKLGAPCLPATHLARRHRWKTLVSFHVPPREGGSRRWDRGAGSG